MSHLLPAFVTPNDPALAPLLKTASRFGGTSRGGSLEADVAEPVGRLDGRPTPGGDAGARIVRRRDRVG